MKSGLVSPARWQHSHLKRVRTVALMGPTLLMFFSMPTSATAQTRVAIILPDNAKPAERIAGDELANHLQILYPSSKFETRTSSAATNAIYLGTAGDLPDHYAAQVKTDLATPDSYTIKVVSSREAIIAGSNPRAALFAVDALLQKLGFGFYLSYSTAPPSVSAPFSFSAWELHDSPIVRERIIFDWHNFLSSCSTWNLDDWQRWITQASRMRFNTIMVHAYGNNPMFSFSYNGQTKPTGYLANTKFGRDFGTEHVLDVRKIVGADGLFDSPVYGADASQVPDNEKVQAAEVLMQNVFKFASARGMGITFALDVDTESANPHNVIATLPASARIVTHGFQLANPDVPEGYAYYRAEIKQLMHLYPDITQLAVWFRGGFTTSPWRGITPSEFPEAWNKEYREALEANPTLSKDPFAPSMFAISKIVKAFRQALDETGHSSVTIAVGSWRYDYLPSADVFMPASVAFMPLDYPYQFPTDPVQTYLRELGRHRRVIPIVWAQHDDRAFAGRSYTPFAGFGSLLRWSNSGGYGVVHWTTRPLDLFFANISDQVWTATFDETLDSTTSEMAKRTFGAYAQELGKRYLLDWIYDGPTFGEETGDRFLPQTIDAKNEIVGARSRLALLAKMMPLAKNQVERDWIGYYEDWEHYAQDIYQAQSALQDSYIAQKAGNIQEAREAIAQADPESAIRKYARAIRHGHTSRGEKGILITLNLRWLPYFEAQRITLGLDPLQVKFAPTYHEPIAQAPGHYTFDFSRTHQPIEVVGTLELGTKTQNFAPNSWCASGIEITSPVDLAVGNMAKTSLPPGIYSMKLIMAPNAEVQVKSGSYNETATSLSDVAVVASEGKVHFSLSPVGSAPQVCGITLRLQSSQ